ncbi:DUF1404 domain-containing protein [Saccharolobus islandicus]|uniref:DUF1404 domain-containing protein n=1 Tax=Saccharolobus islandicus (strain M.16.4 / Kamchatka \|nr:DUF1404 domain-containing protein [Sulfolobus islandicus]ACR42982.1 Protein of unknown function DUF1404 [Sulfolobus islandicus M.16.4]
MNNYFFIAVLIFCIFLIAVSVNPFTEEYMFINPIPYMLAHYSLFGAGILLSYYIIRRKIVDKSIAVIVGASIAFLWHYPYFFNLGAEILSVRLIEEVSLVIGGLMIGSSLKELSRNFKVLLLALWMIGDSILSFILMISPSLYTTVYSPQGLEYVGIIMFLMMNLIAVYLLLKYVNNLLRDEKDVVNEDYQRNTYPKNEH